MFALDSGERFAVSVEGAKELQKWIGEKVKVTWDEGGNLTVARVQR